MTAEDGTGEEQMGTYTFRFEAPGKGVVITMHKGDDGMWIVGREDLGKRRVVCKAELFDYARSAFDAEVFRLETEIQCEVEGR